MKKLYLLIFIIFLLSSCQHNPYKLKTYKFPEPVDTTTRLIEYQVKKTYEIGDVSATNEFPSARLNDFSQLDDSTYQATISAENVPINTSPWYAFKIWSKQPKSVYVKLHYTVHKHRYFPKVSMDGENWERLDSTLNTLTSDSVHAILKLDLTEKPLWIAGQEIQDHRRVGEWVNQWKDHQVVTLGDAGKSVQGRELYFMNLSKGDHLNKPTVIVLSRQHPPEVTGYLAMRAFIETIIEQGATNGFLEKYRVLVYPMMNPDGVDLGHFRHNTGGIDLNRDWAKYHQPETKQITTHIVKEAKEGKNEIVLGLDFHSTHYDVYYTFDETVERKLPGFTKEWLSRIEKELELDDINEQPSGLNQPISKGWFFKQFGAEGIVYEIGDSTPRDFIKTKGEVSAVAMMDILMKMR